ncbi:hypothetical protein [Alteromonas sp. P256]|uniref:hypothetical protein n=1 Tax=Alteromonas sp. P256 TaxID=3117399 RepID=UPI002FE2E107
MDRLFDVNLLADNGWTDGEEWADCNPAQDVEQVYRRIYSDSDYSDPDYRITPGDNFFIASHPSTVRDWTPRTLPWNLDITKGINGNPLSFYFGLQVGEREIDTNLDNHSPWMQKVRGDFIILDAHYHRFFGIKVKDSDPVLKLNSDNRGGEVHGALLSNAGLIDTQGYAMFDWILRKLTFINTIFKALDIPLGSSNVSTQDFDITGTGDCGIVIRAGHSEMEVIGGTIANENHEFSENQTLLYGLELEAGSKALVRYVDTSGFSGNGFKFACEVDAKGLTSSHDGAGFEFLEHSTARDCMVSWTRQLAGDSFAYYFHKGGELNNCGCNLEETGGLGVVVVGPNATLTINGGDYRAHAPLPFASAQGPCTVILNNVMMNGVLYNETVELLEGESWRGEKAEVTIDTLEVYANKTLNLPYMHIPKLDEAIAVQGTERPFHSVVTLPSGARVLPTEEGSLRYMPSEAWLHLDPGETAIDYFRYSTESVIYMHKFVINPSPEVGEKVVQPDSFSGSGFTKKDATYTAFETTGSLSSSYAFEENEVYQISLKLTNCEGGTITPSIGSVDAEYYHDIEGTEVWLIRAPANASAVELKANSLSAVVSNIYVRKLIRTEPPCVPTLDGSVESNEVKLSWKLPPVDRLKNRQTPDVHIQNQELAQNSADGYRSDNANRHYLFENVTVQNRRNGVNLRGCESVEIDGMDFVGGYEGQYETWQTALVAEYRNPYAKIQQIGNVTADLLLESNFGNYNGRFGNCDIFVINAPYWGVGSWGEADKIYTAHIYNLDGKHGSDSIIDCKRITEVNHSSMEGSCKIVRTHRRGAAILNNSEFISTFGTRETFAPGHSPAYQEIWNCVADGIRCVTKEQLKNQKKPNGFAYTGRSLLGGFQSSVEVLKTYPTIDDLNRFAMTDMEFEVSSNGGSSWSPLNVPNVGLPGVVGCFKRPISLSSGTYQIRCRCLNGALTGAWSNTISITV